MGSRKLRQALPSILVVVVVAAAISVVSAQEGSLFTTSSVAQVATSSSVAGGGVLSEDGSGIELALASQTVVPPVTVAQTPPPAVTSEEQTPAAAQPILVGERAWPDAHTTIVECTGEVTRTCQVNVYGPNGEFILGRKISPNGEAADCTGPCLDSTGAPLDASSVSRAQAAVAAGSQTHKVIVSAGAPLPPTTIQTTEVTPPEVEADPIHLEGQ